MKLPFSKLFEKKEEVKYYLAFILRHEKAIAVIFEQTGTQAEVVGKGEAFFDKDIEEATFEELLTVSDKAISKAEEGAPKDLESLKTLFGLKESWIEEDKIKKEYLEKLKKVSDELGLTPIGFVTVTEAITGLLKKEEGAPLTAILTEVGKNYVTVSLIKAGRIMETKSSEIHENPAFTTDVLLKHLEVPDVLPSKLIIYNGGDEDLSQKFISHQWSKSLPFLHLPQIISLPDGFDAKSILQGAASKMGFEIASDTSAKILEEKEEIPAFEETVADKEPEEEETKKDEEEVKEEKEEINYVENDDFVEKFGFFENEDIVKIPPAKKDLGIKEKEEIKEEKEEEGKDYKEEFAREDEEEQEEQKIAYEDLEEVTPKRSGGLLKPLSSFTNFISGIFSKLKLPKNIASMMFLKNKFIGIPVLIILALLILFIYFFFTLKTTVVLTLDPKMDEQKQNVTFSTENTDVDKKIIKGDFVETTLEGTASLTTTGKKETGDKAKGTVTFYSRFTEKMTIDAGTTLTSSNDIDFTLDKDVSIASGSADASASPTTANGNVTAKEIGKEGNLPSGTKFNVGSLAPSSIIAKNENAFSGGTKKEIQVVSEDDTEKLLAQVVKDLTGKALEDLGKKIDLETKILLPVIVDSNFDKKAFDKDIGDEATKLTLKATVNFQGLAYSRKDLISFTKSLLKRELSSKLEIDESNIEVKVSDIKKKATGEVSATLVIKAPLLPSLNKEEISKSISGIKKEDAKEKLLKISQVADVDINPALPIPFLTQSLPRFPNNIEIVTKTNE